MGTRRPLVRHHRYSAIERISRARNVGLCRAPIELTLQRIGILGAVDDASCETAKACLASVDQAGGGPGASYNASSDLV